MKIILQKYFHTKLKLWKFTTPLAAAKDQFDAELQINKNVADNKLAIQKLKDETDNKIFQAEQELLRFNPYLARRSQEDRDSILEAERKISQYKDEYYSKLEEISNRPAHWYSRGPVTKHNTASYNLQRHVDRLYSPRQVRTPGIDYTTLFLPQQEQLSRQQIRERDVRSLLDRINRDRINIYDPKFR